MRDKTVDIMTAIGILFVVMGHNYQPDWFFFPAYTFHMPLFFFISGYLFKIQTRAADKLAFFKKKSKTQLIPYFAFNLGYLLLTLFEQTQGIFERFHFDAYNLLLEPFFSGHQMPFVIPLWFLLQLFLLNLIFQTIYWRTSNKYMHWVTLGVLVVGIVTGYFGLNHYSGFNLLVVRTGMCAMFFQLGIVVSRYREPILKLVSRPLFIFITWLLVVLIANHFGNIVYSPVLGGLENPIYMIPVITSSLIILIVMGISQILSQLIPDRSFFIKIGQSSFWIMSFHLTVFFLVNVAFCWFGLVEKEKLNDIYFNYDVKHLFPIYLTAGIFLSMFFGWILDSIKRKIFRKRVPA